MAAKQRPRAGFAGSSMCGGRDCARRVDIVAASSRGQFRAWLRTNYEKEARAEGAVSRWANTLYKTLAKVVCPCYPTLHWHRVYHKLGTLHWHGVYHKLGTPHRCPHSSTHPSTPHTQIKFV